MVVSLILLQNLIILQKKTILSFFVSHLILHIILQPLDIDCFQSYKHWQKMVVHQALNCAEVNYNTTCFMRDLLKFREKAMTEKSIKNSFEKAGIYPSNIGKVLRRVKRYNPPIKPLPPLITEKNLLSTPKNASHCVRLE
jgi:hypothetical protein